MTKYEAAAKWWADTLRAPAAFNNGEPGQMAFVDPINARLFAARPRTEEQIQKFAELLAKKLETEDPHNGWGWWVVRVDYHAPEILMSTLAEVGIKGDDMTSFPCKTTMRIEEKKVTVGAGYCQPFVTIWEE